MRRSRSGGECRHIRMRHASGKSSSKRKTATRLVLCGKRLTFSPSDTRVILEVDEGWGADPLGRLKSTQRETLLMKSLTLRGVAAGRWRVILNQRN